MFLIALMAAGLHLEPSSNRLDAAFTNRKSDEVFLFLGAATGRKMTVDPCAKNRDVTFALKRVTAQQVFEEVARLLALDYEDDGKEIQVHCLTKHSQ